MTISSDDVSVLRQQVADLQQQVTVLEQQLAAQERDRIIGQTLLQHLPGGMVFVFDHDLRCIEVNGSELEREQMIRTSLIGRTLWEVLPSPLCNLIEGPYRAALRGETITFLGPFGGSTYRVTILPVYDSRGQIIAGMVMLFSVTAQAATERRLSIFEQLVERSPDAIAFNPPAGHLLYINPAFRQMLGYDDAALLEMSVADLFATSMKAEEHFAAVREAVETDGYWTGINTYQRADGSTFPGQTSVFSIPLAGNTPLRGAIVRDVSAEQAAIHERQALQEQVITAQAVALRELATPFIPLADQVVMMPLVGSLDNGRVQQVMETLLTGIVSSQAEYAILDIAGIQTVDTQVAQGLVRVAQAAKLLGAQIILTGLSATIAQTLTELNTDLTGIITRANVQSGIAYAMEQPPVEVLYYARPQRHCHKVDRNGNPTRRG